MIKVDRPDVERKQERYGIPYLEVKLSNGLTLQVDYDRNLMWIEHAFICGPEVRLDGIAMEEFTRSERFAIRDTLANALENKLAEEHAKKVTSIYATLNQDEHHGA